jgi:uncharacterized protein YggL (DUF469 family)
LQFKEESCIVYLKNKFYYKERRIKMNIEELREMGFESQDELLEELCGCDENYSLDDFMDSWDPIAE